MSEIRLYITTTEMRAGIALSLMTEAFEEEGYAIATMEIDEKKDIWEASVYMFREDEAEIHARFAALLADEFPDAPIEREELPDIDWIAKSLEGLKPVRAARFVVHGSHDRGKVRAGEIAVVLIEETALSRMPMVSRIANGPMTGCAMAANTFSAMSTFARP